MASHAQEALPPADLQIRETAVLAAREGQYESALRSLLSLRARHPDDIALLMDQVVVLAWAERDAEALELAIGLDPGQTPVFAALPIAKSARNLQRYDDALTWYTAADRAAPDQRDPLLGLLMTYADIGDRTGVSRTLARIASARLAGPDVGVARGYALSSIGEPFEALHAYESVLADEPTNREALRGKALVLRQLLLPTQALALAAAHPGILSDTEIARLRSDEVAIRVRLASRTPLPAPQNLAASDEALDLLDDYLSRARDPATTQTLRLDRVVALSDANRPADAIGAFEELPQEVAWSHAYVLGAAARSYLQEQRPQEALAALETALRLEPANRELQFALVYTYLDLERFDAAFELSQRLTAEIPMVHESADGAVRKIDQNWLRAEVLAGIVEAYGDQLAAAQARFENLLGEAPGNADARQELANIYRWRGWLDRSMAEYRRVLANDDRMLAARLGHAHAQIDAHEYEAVAVTVEELTRDYPREPATEGLSERWALHNKSELDVSGSSSRSTGSTFGSDSFALDARWFTAPKSYYYRAFVHTHDATATFPEGTTDRRRVGVGLERRAPRWTASGEISGARDGGDAGFAAAVDWRFSDSWSFGALVELDSDDIQLRAHRVGIESDLVGLTARYAANESFAAELGLRQHRLTDGNRQQTLYADARRRLVNEPRWKLDLTGSIAGAASDRETVPYFSPDSAITMLIGLRHEYRVFRRYSRDLSQTVALASGRYDQSAFAAGNIWRFSYELRWQVREGLALGLGAQRSGQYFDGLREHGTSALAFVNARF